jgi:hypothetical protein
MMTSEAYNTDESSELETDLPPLKETLDTFYEKDANTISGTQVSPARGSTSHAPLGTLSEIWNLYRSIPDRDGKTTWTTKIPTDLLDPPDNAESAQYALIARRVKCYDGRRNLMLHSIVVQSTFLKKILGAVLKDYPGVTINLERVEFKSPFEPFVHRWAKFVKARDDEMGLESSRHVDLLFSILEEELQDIISLKGDLIANKVITYDLLWTIFEPGDIIFRLEDDRERAYKFRKGEKDSWTNKYVLAFTYVDFDGNNFGYKYDSLSVSEFQDAMPIASLPAFPLRFHPNESNIRERLIARGRLWEEYKGYHFKHYEEIARGFVMNKSLKFNVNSRIIIDTEAFNHFNPNQLVSISVSSAITGRLSSDQHLIAVPLLRGYGLKDKKWFEFYIDAVKEIVWDEQAFDSLVLPPEQKNLKQLILAFTRSQAKHRDKFDDVIRGKGRGIIMLLSGPPGVGKTLTAESVAEVMKVPLYVMSAGDLGTKAERVEKALEDILRMIPKWGAVLLLDEADVFLEARSSSDLARNELVSIFLRLFEYYEVSVILQIRIRR